MRACSSLFAATALLIAGAGAAGCASPSDEHRPETAEADNVEAGTTGTAGTGGTPAPTTCGPQTPPAPSAGRTFPFPQHRLSSSCGYPTNCNDADVMTAWNTYKTKMIIAAGAGSGLRVQRTENGNDTVSEGIAYGMIFAVYMGDKATFDGLWTYAKAHFDGKGLMHWHIDANGGTVGQGAATDADEDMAFALMMADKQWGGYASDASTQVGTILNQRGVERQRPAARRQRQHGNRHQPVVFRARVLQPLRRPTTAAGRASSTRAT